MRYSEDTAKQQRRIELAASLFNTTVPRRAFSVCHTRKLSYLSCFVWIVSKSNGAASSFRAVLVEDKLCITLFKWLGRPLSLIPVLNQVFENEFMTVFYYHDVHCMQNVQGGLCVKIVQLEKLKSSLKFLVTLQRKFQKRKDRKKIIFLENIHTPKYAIVYDFPYRYIPPNTIRDPLLKRLYSFIKSIATPVLLLTAFRPYTIFRQYLDSSKMDFSWVFQ